jgi:6-pyruvoyltetrahydropterin/6-carboxytetrahydropterin synthase
MHGHRWDIEVTLEGEVLNRLNILADFGGVKTVLKAVLEKLDHYVLNEVLKESELTAEFLAKWIYEWLANPFTELEPEVTLTAVTVWESPECSVTYTRAYSGRLVRRKVVEQ